MKGRPRSVLSPVAHLSLWVALAATTECNPALDSPPAISLVLSFGEAEVGNNR